MWWSRALVCVMVLALGPVGCGFQPIYARSGGATSSAIADQLASVQVSAIEDRTGQQLRNNLVQALSPRGEPAGARYRLDVRLSETPQSMAISKDGNATIGRVNMNVTYDLVDMRSGNILMTRSARSFSGYRYLGPRYASTVSEREAEGNALSEIADEIRSVLISYFNDPSSYHTRQAGRPVGYNKTPSPQDSE